MSAAFGQRVIYNQNLDKQGQDAAAMAKAISGDSVTAREMANLAAIERQQIDMQLTAALNTMRLEIQSFDTWQHVYRALGNVLRAVNTFQSVTETKGVLIQRQADVKLSAEAVKTVIEQQRKQREEELKKQGKPFIEQASTDLNAVVSHLSDVNDLLQFADQVQRSTAGSKAMALANSAAVGTIENGLKEVNDLLKSAAAAFAAAKAVAVDPHSLMPSRDELSLSVLLAEAESLKERIAIRARFELEKGEVVELATSTRAAMESDQINDGDPQGAKKLAESTRLISETFKHAKLQDKETLLSLLFDAAAVAAQGPTPAALMLMRDTIAQRRFEIRRAAIYNGAYEQALQTAGQRLSAYYASGIKPSQIAQFLYYLSGIVSLPAIAF
jgi:hypothetical protein